VSEGVRKGGKEEGLDAVSCIRSFFMILVAPPTIGVSTVLSVCLSYSHTSYNYGSNVDEGEREGERVGGREGRMRSAASQSQLLLVFSQSQSILTIKAHTIWHHRWYCISAKR
jgi:hypothetical protein